MTNLDKPLWALMEQTAREARARRLRAIVPLLKGAGVGLGMAVATLAIVLILAVMASGCGGTDYESPGERCDRTFNRCVELHGDNPRAQACADNYAVCMVTATATVGVD